MKGDAAGVTLGDQQSETTVTAIDRLMVTHINAFCWNEVKNASLFYADPDAFRRDRLYFEEVNDAFLTHADDLLVVYETYAQKSALRLREFNSALKLLCYQEFEDLLQFSGILVGDDVDGKFLDARRSFVFAQMTCCNNLSRNPKERSKDVQNRATFIEFCEALARLCDLGQSKNQVLPTLSAALVPFLSKFIEGVGSEFFKARKNKGHYHRTVTKKFGNLGKGKSGCGPEVGRYELDKSPQAVAHRRRHRKNAATQLPTNLSHILFEVEEKKVDLEDQEGSKRDKRK